ncbi:DUF6680 family protein [Aerococcus viridans]|uniref:DUF6680 family protein n=1 Tax=Aerococcus urinaeequi TaxID=51665 RepID=UPI0022E62009|nr:DUF6680 family protein [Aerococcus urinaeequi]
MQWTTLLATLIGAIASLVGGILQQMYTQYQTEKQIEKEEKNQKEKNIRQEKLETLRKILIYKRVLVNGAPVTLEDQVGLNEVLGLVPLIFSDDKKVIEAHKKFLNNATKNMEDKEDPNELFYNLISSMYSSLDLTIPSKEQILSGFYLKF